MVSVNDTEGEGSGSAALLRRTPDALDAGPFIECAKCGDHIRSMNRHDFRSCKCGETFVDGGSDYLRCGGHAVMDGERIAIFTAE